MPDETQLIYLEPDDEITTVVRRLREADAPRLVLVASGRTKATTSAVALRLLAQVAAEEGREVVLVADAAARALAAEAGIPAFASVADANSEGAVPAPALPPASAPIHVVRGEEPPAIVDEPPAAAPPVEPPRGLEETQAVQLPPSPGQRPQPRRPSPSRERRAANAGVPTVALIVMLALLVAMGAAIGIVLPAASVTIQRQPVAIGPVDYSVTPELHAADGETLESTQEGEATGHRTRRTAATGTVLLINYTGEDVFVPAGTVVSAGREILFQTTEGVTVPNVPYLNIPGTATTTVEALEAGTSGNVEALAIDRIEDRDVDRALGGPGGDRRIRNEEPTSGGDERELTVVRRADVLRVRNAVRNDLEEQFSAGQDARADRIYASGEEPKVEIPIPDDLVGRVSQDPLTFELTGQLVDERPYVLRPDVEAAAQERLMADAEAAPAGASVATESIEVEVGRASLDGETMAVVATVVAEAIPDVNEPALRTRLAGLTAEEAEALLAPIGPSSVELWPAWVDRVPRLEWRISIDVQAADASS